MLNHMANSQNFVMAFHKKKKKNFKISSKAKYKLILIYAQCASHIIY